MNLILPFPQLFVDLLQPENKNKCHNLAQLWKYFRILMCLFKMAKQFENRKW
jgi:hypothetical protein